MARAAARENVTTPQYGAHGCSTTDPGSARASSHAVPAPPKPLWLIPSPMNAQRRETTKTDSVAQATAIAVAVKKAGEVKNLSHMVFGREAMGVVVTSTADRSRNSCAPS